MTDNPRWTVPTNVQTLNATENAARVPDLANDVQDDPQARAVDSVGAGSWSMTATGTPLVPNGGAMFVASETGSRGVAEKTAAGQASALPCKLRIQKTTLPQSRAHLKAPARSSTSTVPRAGCSRRQPAPRASVRRLVTEFADLTTTGSRLPNSVRGDRSSPAEYLPLKPRTLVGPSS